MNINDKFETESFFQKTLLISNPERENLGIDETREYSMINFYWNNASYGPTNVIYESGNVFFFP